MIETEIDKSPEKSWKSSNQNISFDSFFSVLLVFIKPLSASVTLI